MKIRAIVLFAFITLAFIGCKQRSSSVIKVTDKAVQVPVGKFFLVRHRRHYAAIMLTKPSPKADEGYQYIWHYMHIDNQLKNSGSGEVFCKYNKVLVAPNQWEISQNIDSITYMKCNGLEIKWSTGNWISYNSPTGDLEIAITNERKFDRISFSDPNLVWYKQGLPKQLGTSVKPSNHYSDKVVGDYRENPKIKALIQKSGALVLAEYEPSGKGNIEAVITKIIKIDPGFDFNYKVGERPPRWAYIPNGNSRGDALVAFFTNGSALGEVEEVTRMACYGKRVRSLEDIPVSSLLKLAQEESESKKVTRP